MLQDIEYIEFIAIHSDWDEFIESYPDIAHKLNSRAIANIVSCLIASHAKRIFNGVNGVKIKPDAQTFMITVDRKVNIRFKKLNNDLTSNNIKTINNEIYLNQGLTAINLIAGYKLNGLQTEIDSVYVTYPSGSKKIAWSMNLTRESGQKRLFSLHPDVNGYNQQSNVKIKTKKEAKKDANEK